SGVQRVAAGKGEEQRRAERIPRAVGVLERSGTRGGLEPMPVRDTAPRALRGDEDAHIEASVVLLARVGAAADQEVEADGALAQGGNLAWSGGEVTGRACRVERGHVA